MARRADRVIVCSHYMRGHVADVFGIAEDGVAVVPNGIDPLDLRPVGDLAALRAEHAAPDERLVLLTGRLVYEKGFQVALDALPGVIRRVGRVRFLVAGAGTYRAELEERARRLGLDAHGTFLGWIGDDLLHSLYRIADLCVVPSLYEPFGLVALEAMASGCPCIVADTGGLREVVPNDDVGLRFASRDSRSLARMMTLVLANPAVRYRLVTEASEHVLRFDWARRRAQDGGGLRRAGAGRPRPRTRGARPYRPARPYPAGSCPSCCWSPRRRDSTAATSCERLSARRRGRDDALARRGCSPPAATATASSARPPASAGRRSWSSRPAAPTSQATCCSRSRARGPSGCRSPPS